MAGLRRGARHPGLLPSAGGEGALTALGAPQTKGRKREGGPSPPGPSRRSTSPCSGPRTAVHRASAPLPGRLGRAQRQAAAQERLQQRAGFRQRAVLAHPASPRPFPPLVAELGRNEAQATEPGPRILFLFFSKTKTCINYLNPQMNSEKYKPSVQILLKTSSTS